jgi:hypothetical protein
MNRRHSVLVALLLIALGGNLALAAAPYIGYLPVVYGAAEAQLQTTPVILVDADAVLNNAVAMQDTRPGAAIGARRFFVAYALVPVYKLRVAEDVNGVLVDLPQVPAALQAALAPGPAWSPDNPKNGGAVLVPVPGGLRIYYTGRKPGNPTGVFPLWRVELPVSGVAP